jgi:hypothetical protein
MNSLAASFDNAKARQGLQMLVESQQEAYLAATGMSSGRCASRRDRRAAAP